jgi:hypothetical protein
MSDTDMGTETNYDLRSNGRNKDLPRWSGKRGLAILRTHQQDKVVVNFVFRHRDSGVSQAGAYDRNLQLSGSIVALEPQGDDLRIDITITGDGTRADGKKGRVEITHSFWGSDLLLIQVIKELAPSLIEVPKMEVATR